MLSLPPRWQPILLLLTSTLLCASAIANDWPEFRGPTRNGVSTATNVPLHWSADENIAWKKEIPGNGWSSPVLADGRLYLTTATGSAETNDVSLRTLCIDATEGKILWNIELFRPASDLATKKHDKNGLASPTPIVDGNRLYVHFGHMGTAALDLQGNILWRQTDVHYDPMHGNAGSPTLAGNMLIFSCDGEDTQNVVALDLATGDIRWKTPRGETSAAQTFSFSTPQTIHVEGQPQVISPGSGFVGSYDPADGHEIWRVAYGEGFSVVPRPVYAHGHIYLSSGFMRPILFAINPRGAKGDVTQSHVAWQHPQKVPNTPSMIVVDNEIYFVSDKGVATCLNAHSGEVHWTKRLGGNYTASPFAAEDHIYFTSEEGITHVVRADTEYEKIATNDLGQRTFASLAPDNGKLFIRTESHLWRINK